MSKRERELWVFQWSSSHLPSHPILAEWFLTRLGWQSFLHLFKEPFPFPSSLSTGVWLRSSVPPSPPRVDRTSEELLPRSGHVVCQGEWLAAATRGCRSCSDRRPQPDPLNQAGCVSLDNKPLGLSFSLDNRRNNQLCLCPFLLPRKCVENKVDFIGRNSGLWRKALMGRPVRRKPQE